MPEKISDHYDAPAGFQDTYVEYPKGILCENKECLKECDKESIPVYHRHLAK